MKTTDWISLELAPKSDALLVTFAATPLSDGKPAFAFVNVSDSLPVKKAFLIDPYDCLYQKGIPGVGGDFWGVAQYIRELARREGVSRIVTIGNSAGGYAAIVFGVLAGADDIHAFNPPTLLTERKHFHSPSVLRHVEGLKGRSRGTLDLRQFILNELQPQTHAYVYYSHGNTIDRERTLLLSDTPNVRLVGFPHVEHELARYLAKEGTITRMLDASLTGRRDILESVIRGSIFKARVNNLPHRAARLIGRMQHRLNPPQPSPPLLT